MSVAACAGIVQSGDPDRFLATMAAPVPLRARLFPLFALNVEVSRAPWVTQEPTIAEMRLQWWRDAVEGMAQGAAPRAHEVAAPLAGVVRDADLPVVLIDQMIAARRWDIWRDPFEDAAHFDDYLDRTAGHLMWLGCLCAAADPSVEPAARAVARAQGLANWFVAVPALEAAGRLPLVEGTQAAVRALADEALAGLALARRTSFGPAVPVLRTAWRAEALLRQAVAEPGRVAAGQLRTSEFSRRAGLLRRAALGRW